MLKLFIGEKGTGKTKNLIDGVHAAEANEKGDIVFITASDRHTFDISYRIRLIDASEALISTYGEFYGLIAGILSQNYDVTSIFVDSITKIAKGTEAELDECLNKISALAEAKKISVSATISMKESEASETIKKYL